MLEFSISNQLLSRLDATKVVADSENYLECSFQFSGDWANTVAVATFGHSQVAEPISVRIVDGKCLVPHEVIKTYGFQLSVYGTAEEDRGLICHIPTNVVAVEVEASGAGEGMTPAAPTKDMYDSLMAAIVEGETAATAAKVSAQASAEMADGAKKRAEAAALGSSAAAEKSAVSATSCAVDAESTREIWALARVLDKCLMRTWWVNQSYVMGSGNDRQICKFSNIQWTDGCSEQAFQNLVNLSDGRFRVRVDDTWYDVVGNWDLVEIPRIVPSDEAELLGLSPRIKVEDEVPEIPKGEEANPGGGGEGETPEIPGGEEVNPGDNTGGSTENVPVVKPIISYKTEKNVLKLVAGPVTIEDIEVDKSKDETRLCRLTTIDSTVREVEIRTDGNWNAKYFYEQAVAAAARAEAAAARAEAANG